MRVAPIDAAVGLPLRLLDAVLGALLSPVATLRRKSASGGGGDGGWVAPATPPPPAGGAAHGSRRVACDRMPMPPAADGRLTVRGAMAVGRGELVAGRSAAGPAARRPRQLILHDASCASRPSRHPSPPSSI